MTAWRSGDRTPGWGDRDDNEGFVPRGPRREPPAICYICGDDVPSGPRFGLEACCDRPECREAMVRR